MQFPAVGRSSAVRCDRLAGRSRAGDLREARNARCWDREEDLCEARAVGVRCEEDWAEDLCEARAVGERCEEDRAFLCEARAAGVRCEEDRAEDLCEARAAGVRCEEDRAEDLCEARAVDVRREEDRVFFSCLLLELFASCSSGGGL